MRLKDAEELKTAIREHFHDIPTEDFVYGIETAIEVIEDAPTIEERKKGEWEDKEVFNETNDDHIVDEWQSARCSVCGLYHTTPFSYYFFDYNFCPYCGADNREEKTNE